MCMCVYHMHGYYLQEARGGHCIPWDSNFRGLRPTMWVLGLNHWAYAGVASAPLSHM